MAGFFQPQQSQQPQPQQQEPDLLTQLIARIQQMQNFHVRGSTPISRDNYVPNTTTTSNPRTNK